MNVLFPGKFEKFRTCVAFQQEEVKAAEIAIQCMGASLLQLCPGTCCVFGSSKFNFLRGRKVSFCVVKSLE